MEKGQYGYMKRRKDHNFRFTLFCAALVLAFAVAGFLIWHTRFNYLMIPAMLCVIPMANFAVSFLAISKYFTPPEELHEMLSSYEKAGLLLCDMVIVDDKGGRTGLPFAVVYKNGVVAWQANAKEKKDAAEITINSTLKRRGIPMRAKIYKDWQDFMDRVQEIEPVLEDEYVRRVELAREAVLSVSM